MSRLVRIMLKSNDLPQCGSADCQLGVRVPPHSHPDVRPVDGVVEPRQGGMSVFSDIHKMPKRLIPARFHEIYPGALGEDDMFVWVTGEGDFGDGQFNEHLELRLDNPKKRKYHALVEPTKPVHIDTLQAHLADTACHWQEFTPVSTSED